MNGEDRVAREWNIVMAITLLVVLGLYLLTPGLKDRVPKPAATASSPVNWSIEEVAKAAECGRNYATNCSVLPLAYSSGWEGRIEFADLDTMEGLWRGSHPRIVAKRLHQDRAGETNKDSWGNELSKVGSPFKMETVTPWIKIRLSPIDRRYLHKIITGTAMLDIAFPKIVGAHFVNEASSLRREVKFFVITPEERDFIEKTDQWTTYKFLFTAFKLISGSWALLIGLTPWEGNVRARWRWLLVLIGLGLILSPPPFWTSISAFFH